MPDDGYRFDGRAFATRSEITARARPRQYIESRNGTIAPCKPRQALPVDMAIHRLGGVSVAQQKTNPKLEQALTRGDLAIRQANSGRATALLRALGKMIVDASATIGVDVSTLIPDGDRIYDPA